MRVIANVPIVTENRSNFDDYAYADDGFRFYNVPPKPYERTAVDKKEVVKTTGSSVPNLSSMIQATKIIEEAKNQEKGKKTKSEKRENRLANKKPKKNARKLFVKKDKNKEDKFFYPLTKLFKKDGKWFKKEKDGTNTEVETENVVQADPNFRFYNVTPKPSEPIAVDKTEVLKATGSSVPNWSSVFQATKMIQEAKNQGVLPIPIEKTNVTITNDGAFLNAEVQEKDKSLEDVKNDEKNKLTNTQKYIVWGLSALAVAVIGYAIYKYRRN